MSVCVCVLVLVLVCHADLHLHPLHSTPLTLCTFKTAPVCNFETSPVCAGTRRRIETRGFSACHTTPHRTHTRRPFGSRSLRKRGLLIDCWFLFCVLVSRSMVRRGWSQLDVPTRWVQIVRGPRPKSVAWPRANFQPTKPQVAPAKPPQRRTGVAPQTRPRLSPEAVEVS